MRKTIGTSTFILLLQCDSFAHTNGDTKNLESNIAEIGKSLYEDAEINRNNNAYEIDLYLRNSKYGYDFDTIRFCQAESNYSAGEWILIKKEAEEYFNSPNYTEIRSCSLNSMTLTSAFSFCQVSNKNGEVSMAGQCYTVIGENEGNKFTYTTYLGRAVKCRQDETCWHSAVSQRKNFY